MKNEKGTKKRCKMHRFFVNKSIPPIFKICDGMLIVKKIYSVFAS